MTKLIELLKKKKCINHDTHEEAKLKAKQKRIRIRWAKQKAKTTKVNFNITKNELVSAMCSVFPFSTKETFTLNV